MAYKKLEWMAAEAKNAPSTSMKGAYMETEFIATEVSTPIIEVSDRLRAHAICGGCGSLDGSGQPIAANAPLRSYHLRTGQRSTFTVTWCDTCALKVTLALLTAQKAIAQSEATALATVLARVAQ